MNGMWEGVLLTMLAGLATGATFWPMKVIRRLQFEHYWFIGMLPVLLLPWLVVLLTIPDPWVGFCRVGWRPLVIANTFAVGWGIANILSGLCVVRIGLALTGAIVTGLGMTVAVTIPMVFKGTGLFSNSPDLFSTSGLTVMSAVGVMLCGVAFTAIAGFGRECILKTGEGSQAISSGSFFGGLVMASLAGVLSSGPALAFVYGNGPIVAAMRAQGASELSSSCSVWAGGFLGGALVNLLYPAWLMTRRRSWPLLRRNLGEVSLATVIGTQLIIGFGLQGLGMVALGSLGASIGTGIQQAMQITSTQAVGLVSGEWRGIGGQPWRFMMFAVALLLTAVLMMGVANSLS